MSSEPVQTGFWIDYSKGVILGPTLTCKAPWDSLLVTAASVTIQIIGSAVWILAAYWLHQCLTPSDDKYQDEFEAQRSVVLRNSGAVSILLSLYSIGKTWHGHIPKARRRALITMIMPCVLIIGFAIAGVLIGSVALDPQKSHALVRPSLCGNMMVKFSAGSDGDIKLTPYYLHNNTTIRAKIYAQDCYVHEGWSSSQCNSFAVSTLPYQNSTAPCPFEAGSCATSQAVSYTTMLDSHEDLGINAKGQDRLRYGYNLTCVPSQQSLLDQLVVNTTITTSGLDNYTTITYNISQSDDPRGTLRISNMTRLFGGTSYNVKSYASAATSLESDTTAILVDKGSLLYSGPNNEPIFATESTPSYMMKKRLASLIGCSESYRFCNPTNTKCTPWAGQLYFLTNSSSGYLVNESIVEELELNGPQNATYHRLHPSSTDVSALTVTTNESPLRASQQLVLPPISVQLPQHQWELEIALWYQTSLARLQIVTQGVTNIPAWVSDTYEVVPFDSAEGRKQCSTQRRLLPTGYQTYNVFGLVLTALLGVISVTCAIAIRLFHGRLLPYRKPNERYHNKYLAFVTDGQLQLHRAALQGAGFHGWAEDINSGNVPYVSHGSRRLPVAVLAKVGSDEKSQVDGEAESSHVEDAEYLLPRSNDLPPKLPDLRFEDEPTHFH
ncbi:hypothetical protein H2200_013041 [Cladophialophora chaetospira]|uniref:Uncharacterized protein n=1 Tax=Cladophialophora chaetospira TaxID=386627 RepID=A0AA38WWM4_9EURO|nr:hypothetical protein H2200_013041 [Cladophialophora chaetospira]